jgi:magnesium transporter
MVKEFDTTATAHFRWLDIVNPSLEELQNVAAEFSLHPTSVQDCLDPDHLPKVEEFEHFLFIITRIFDQEQKSDADTIQEVSRKIAIFCGKDFIITIHRSEQPFLKILHEKNVLQNKCKNVMHLLYLIMNKVIQSYEQTEDLLAAEIDLYESKIFLKSRVPKLLKSLYQIKRKSSVISRILFLSKSIVHKLQEGERRDPLYRDVLDNFIQIETGYDQINEQINNLLSLYLSISAQRTNEVIRVLTIFSVFFMPLTFIVGIYGMNFKVMPEIDWQYGYAYAIVLMIAVTLAIYFWFKRKGWL